MCNTPTDILTRIAAWSETAQTHFLSVRGIVHDVTAHADIGPLDESLKWGQPAWRPKRTRIGSTLRVDWSPSAPDRMLAFVDCKTDLAVQMDARYPGQFHNDGRRTLGFAMGEAFDEDAIWTLAHLTLTYHRAKRGH